MLKNYIILILALGYFSSATAQDLLSPSFAYSHKKTSYFTLTSGKEVKGNVAKIKRKKGLIKFIKIVDGNGTKQKYVPGDIKHMYLMPSGLDKMTKALAFLNDATKWNDEKMDQDLLNQGYVYFENTRVKIKKKEMTLMMQLLNPTFSKTVKVYHDPYAKETMSAGVGGVKVAGGIAKSYFVKVGNDAAYKLKKKDYKKEFKPLWNSCDNVTTKFTDVKWKDLTKHIVEYTGCGNSSM